MTWCRELSEQQENQFTQALNEMVQVAFNNITPYFLNPLAVDDKANGTPVTQADKSTELLLREYIEKRWPEHGIFGEEYGIKEATGTWPRYRWILDPIDGTRAFISHSFHFGTLIALECSTGPDDRFRPIISVVAFAAARVWALGTGKACWLYRMLPNGETERHAVHVRETVSLSEATVLTTSHWTTPEQVGDSHLQAVIDQAKLYRTWGDCFGYFAVATGGADVMIDPDLSYWDVAALLPVVEGAGGILTSTTGRNPLEELSAVCCATPELHSQILTILAH